MGSPIVSPEQIEKLHKAGWQIVPIIPDMNMRKASVEVLTHYDESQHSYDVMRWHGIWPAMLSASPAPIGIEGE